MAQARDFDIIVYGATGFTGGLACEYLDTSIGLAKANETPKKEARAFQSARDFYHVNAGYAKKVGDVKWAIAGRDVAKLQKLLSGLKTCAGVVHANSSDPKSIDDMVGRTRVLLSFAGPFMLYGTPVVESCAKLGTHYCDSTGELPWVQALMKKYSDLAAKNNALIVPMCGFDCVPSDLGVLYAVQRLRERGARSVVGAHLYSQMVGRMSGGTLTTGILMETKYKDIVDDPFNLGGGPENDDHLKQALANQKDARYAEDLSLWTAPFVMENLNTRVVRRSASDLGYRSKGQGGFRYSESSIAGTETRAKKMSSSSTVPPEKRKQMMDQGRLPKPGEGPSFADRRASFFQSLVNAKADDGTQVWVSITGGDCGYEDTSLMCCEAALCLALEYDALPKRGGVLTPSVAFGSTLIERLDRAGIRFRVVGNPKIALKAAL